MSVDPVQAAIERGEVAAAVLNRHRDALFPHLTVLLQAFGAAHLRAIAAGAVEACIIAHERRARSETPRG